MAPSSRTELRFVFPPNVLLVRPHICPLIMRTQPITSNVFPIAAFFQFDQFVRCVTGVFSGISHHNPVSIPRNPPISLHARIISKAIYRAN